MPLKSAAQAAYLKHNNPKVFAEFKAATPKGKKLPYKVKPNQAHNHARKLSKMLGR